MEVARHSAFAFLDILGYGKIMVKEPMVVVELIQELLRSEKLNRIIQRDLDRYAQFSSSHNVISPKIEYLHFSDSLLIWLGSEPNSPSLFKESVQLLETVSYATSLIVASFMSAGIPMRGAIGLGDAYFSKTPLFFTGRELYITIKHERKQNWAGVALTPNAAKIIVPDGLRPFVLKYGIPVKMGKNNQLNYALNWVTPLAASKELEPPWEQMLEKSTNKEKLKIEETKKFFDYASSAIDGFPLYLSEAPLLALRDKFKKLSV